MLELLFLLLPVAVCYGWYMGKRSASEQGYDEYARLSQKYISGIHFLLSDQPEKASEQLTSLLELENDSFDIHLALGNLFRQRGEIDRAIHIHKNLITCLQLAPKERDTAQIALAKDYIRAGFLEKAESILVRLDNRAYHQDAQQQLLEIYIQTQEWHKAIEIAMNLQEYHQDKMRVLITHFYCQLADHEIAIDKQDSARDLLKQAQKFDQESVRVHLTMAQVEMTAHQYEHALRSLKSAIFIDMEHLKTAMPMLLVCYQKLDTDSRRLKEDMMHFVQCGGGYSALSILVKVLYEEQQVEQAKAVLFRELHRHPTIAGLYHVIRLNLQETHSNEARITLQVLLDLVKSQIELAPAYQCQQCGFEMKKLFWRCPTCQSWGKIKPVQELVDM